MALFGEYSVGFMKKGDDYLQVQQSLRGFEKVPCKCECEEDCKKKDSKENGDRVKDNTKR